MLHEEVLLMLHEEVLLRLHEEVLLRLHEEVAKGSMKTCVELIGFKTLI